MDRIIEREVFRLTDLQDPQELGIVEATSYMEQLDTWTHVGEINGHTATSVELARGAILAWDEANPGEEVWHPERRLLIKHLETAVESRHSVTQPDLTFAEEFFRPEPTQTDDSIEEARLHDTSKTLGFTKILAQVAFETEAPAPVSAQTDPTQSTSHRRPKRAHAAPKGGRHRAE